MSEAVLAERDGAVTTLTLNRPEKRNALSAGLIDEMLSALSRAHGDGTRLLVLRGAGEGFSGGFDFGGIEAQSDGDLALRFIRVELVLQALYHAPFATLALVHGACYGAAADMVCCCTRRIAATDAKFRMPGLRFGIVLGTRRLAATIGKDAARDILESSRVFGAKEALGCGFLTGLHGQDQWPGIIAEAAASAGALPADSHRMLLARTLEDRRAEDMDALVRSVSEPGLKWRIQDFVAASARKPGASRS
ncbi:MAG: enoyl-CoA hydratase/isomerase family protein [Hyphomicrobiales bacterium]